MSRERLRGGREGDGRTLGGGLERHGCNKRDGRKRRADGSMREGERKRKMKGDVETQAYVCADQKSGEGKRPARVIQTAALWRSCPIKIQTPTAFPLTGQHRPWQQKGSVGTGPRCTTACSRSLKTSSSYRHSAAATLSSHLSVSPFSLAWAFRRLIRRAAILSPRPVLARAELSSPSLQPI